MVEQKKGRQAKPKVKAVVKKTTEKQTSIISPELKSELSESKIVTRGRVFVGKIISTKAQKTVTIEWPRRRFLPKYERFEKRRTRIQAHKPNSISVKLGDKVRVSECRPISKTKKFVIIEKVEVKK